MNSVAGKPLANQSREILTTTCEMARWGMALRFSMVKETVASHHALRHSKWLRSVKNNCPYVDSNRELQRVKLVSSI